MRCRKGVNTLSSREVKVYRIEGSMLISCGGKPKWQKFKKEVIATKPEEALEKVYSVLGGTHKLKRKNIRVYSVREIALEESESLEVVGVLSLQGFVK
ncbi:MAG: 50S ribosomal protein L18Ae [Sulfolobales archaeon]|nr:50S ribosomal protein L18Ae [Sulfolobales archaeon]MCX8199495.1 50S ribosomal protein L18Ae [Sulfolobales archaeon]MDW8170829.1 50S ribosomal protein L18Ae [Desulfurococcaceae archaeon]